MKWTQGDEVTRRDVLRGLAYSVSWRCFFWRFAWFDG